MSESLAKWAQCEARAIHEPPGRRGPVPAWAWLGVLVRHGLLGRAPPETPASLQMSQALATLAQLRGAAEDCAERAGAKLLQRGVELLQPGAMGYVDLALLLGYAEGEGGGDVVIRVVTDHLVAGAWLRVAAGCVSADPTAVKWGAVLHAPYTRPGYAEWEQRPIAALLDAHGALAARRADVVDQGKAPIRSPGHHCASCRVADCAVRPGRKV